MADNKDSVESSDARSRIAVQVLLWSGIALAVIALGIGFSSIFADKDTRPNILNGLLNAYLPLIGTWVGTVLAFYFSRENFETASKQTNRMLETAMADRLVSTSAKSVMIPFEQIEGLLDEKKNKDKKVFGPKGLIDHLTPPVTRIVVTSGSKVSYVIHDSIIYKYAASNGNSFDLTLESLISEDTYRRIISQVAFVDTVATLADVKVAMERLEFCRDVFLTPDGRSDLKPIGWITNQVIAKYSKA